MSYTSKPETKKFLSDIAKVPGMCPLPSLGCKLVLPLWTKTWKESSVPIVLFAFFPYFVIFPHVLQWWSNRKNIWPVKHLSHISVKVHFWKKWRKKANGDWLTLVHLENCP